MLQYLDISALRGIENQASSTSARPGSLRKATGVAPYPAGSLTTGLQWLPFLADGDSPIGLSDLFDPAPNTQFYKAYVWNVGAMRFLIIGKIGGKPHITGLFHLEGDLSQADPDERPASTVTLIDTANLSDRPWFASRVLDRIYFGNGTDANLRYHNGQVGLFPDPEPEDSHDKAIEQFPPCRCFALGRQRQIFAAGNDSNPLRVWISPRMTDSTGLAEGIESPEFSYVDITPAWQGDYPITALSVFQHYLSVHTAAGVVSLSMPDGSADGFKSQQQASPTNAGAANPACTMDVGGFADVYLGADGLLYHDHSVRSGPYSKRYGHGVDVAPAKALGSVSVDAGERVGMDAGSVFFDRERGLVWAANRTRQAPDWGQGLWCYSMNANALTGPILSPPIAKCTAVQTPSNVSERGLVALTPSGRFWFARYRSIEEPVPLNVSRPATFPSEHAPATAEEVIDLSRGLPFVNATPEKQDLRFIRSDYDAFPDGVIEQITEGLEDHPNQLFPAAHPVLLELGWFDLGSPNRNKVFRELRLTCDWDQPVYGYVTVRSDRGIERTVIHALTLNAANAPVSQPVFRFNITGKRIHVFLTLIAFVERPVILRSISIGFRPAGAVSSR